VKSITGEVQQNNRGGGGTCSDCSLDRLLVLRRNMCVSSDCAHWLTKRPGISKADGER
jgi:hypothetical protein